LKNPSTAIPSVTPTLKSRIASMVYESMLLFGVIFVTGFLFSYLAGQRHALYLRHFLQGWLLFVLCMYFIWFWTHGGQTLAMKTWRIRLVAVDGAPVTYGRALLRFLLCWLWILPGLALAWLLGAQTSLLIWIPLLNMLLWALTARLDPQHQFLHDRIAGTRLVAVQEEAGKALAA
jgi:uncharacterized RDD family membrane protein YckC